MTLSLHLPFQQYTLESITTADCPSKQKQQSECPGLKLTYTSRLGDIAEYVVITESLKRGAEVYKNVGCTGKTDVVIDLNGNTLHVDVKVEEWDVRSNSYYSPGISGAIKDRVTARCGWRAERRRARGQGGVDWEAARDASERRALEQQVAEFGSTTEALYEESPAVGPSRASIAVALTAPRVRACRRLVPAAALHRAAPLAQRRARARASARGRGGGRAEGRGR